MKRLLAFLVLLGLGLVALRLAIGSDDVLSANVQRTEPQGQPPVRTTPGVVVQQGKIGASIAQTGLFEMPRYRTVKLPDGRERHEQVFFLRAEDSQPVREGLQQLDRVEVTLFERDAAGKERPAAKLRARQAFVELSQDANGRPSLREDKEIDLRDAVFTTEPGGKLAGLRLELGNARVQVRDDEVQIHTPNELDPVLLVLDGARRGTLRGKGLQARLPRDPQGAMRRADIEVLHDPILETAGVEVRARGRLHYTEDTSTGAALLTVDDAVQLDFTGAGGLQLPGMRAPAATASTGAQRATVRGDQFSGWLLRGKQLGLDGEQHDSLGWRVLQLVGAPAVVEAPGMHLSTPRITVLPGLFGDPFLVTAHGGASRLEQIPDATANAAGKRADPVVGTSPRRIHLVMPGEHAGAMHRAFGFPQWTVRPLRDLNVLAFEGAARLAAGPRTLDTSDGIHVFRPDPRLDAVAARGFGTVRIEQRGVPGVTQELLANGSDGCWLRADPKGEQLVLGPAVPTDPAGDPRWRTHRYDLRHGDALLQGVGGCRVVRTVDRTWLHLRAPGTEIEGRLQRDEARVTGVRSLDAEFDAETLRTMTACGLPATTTFLRDGETLTATAPRIEQIGPASWCLLPADATDRTGLWQELAAEHVWPQLRRSAPAAGRRGAEQVETRAPRIEIHHAGGNHAIVDVLADAQRRATATARIEHPDGRVPTTLSLDAARLRLYPFVVSPEAMQLHAAGARGLLAELPFQSMRQPWLVGDEVRNVTLQDAEQGLVEGEGHRLLLSRGAEAVLMVGDPDRLAEARISRLTEDRFVEARGARVRLFRDGDLRLQALRTFPGRSLFLLPNVTMRQPGANSALAHMTAACRGDIDVLPDAIVFAGPVVAHSLLADGSRDPNGMQVDARELHMERLQKTGEIVRVTGRDVNLDWNRMTARSAEIELDLRWSKCIARDPQGAEVHLPDDRTFTAPRIEVNYDTMAVRCFHGRLTQGKRPAADHDPR